MTIPRGYRIFFINIKFFFVKEVLIVFVLKFNNDVGILLITKSFFSIWLRSENFKKLQRNFIFSHLNKRFVLFLSLLKE